MTIDLASGVFLGLPRPEYVSLPETFISALAWSLNPERKVDDDRLSIGRIFRPVDQSSSLPKRQSFSLEVSSPQTNEALVNFGSALKSHGVQQNTLGLEGLATAVLNSIAGIRPTNGIAQAVSPLTPHVSLLQNTRGTAAKNNPADIARYIELMYAMGKQEMGHSSAASKWYSASIKRLQYDPVLTTIDRAVKDALLPSSDIPTFTIGETGNTSAFSTESFFPNSPYAWFARVWDRLTSEEWVRALPARVWVDWATTVLRLAAGLGYLWEAVWYGDIARAILTEENLDQERFRDRDRTTVPWKSSRAQVSIRDVSAPMKRTVVRGRLIRDYLQNLQIEKSSDDVDSLIAVIEDLRGRKDVTEKLTELLGTRASRSPNEWELIRYALVAREESGPYTDYYGLIRPRGRRFSIVDPGTEWIAVIASLCAGHPGAKTTVSNLMFDLNQMGLQPEINDIISLLERAGIARGSADADQGVEITSAY